MPEQNRAAVTDPSLSSEGQLGGAVGAGLALIVLPCVALLFVLHTPSALFTVTLPILAIFGIMILFGALALVSTLFRRLRLSDTTQPLALPEGSIRAVIALSLIVLFAIISIMLYQTDSKPYVIRGVSAQTLADILKNNSNRLVAVTPEKCAKAVNPSSRNSSEEGETAVPTRSRDANSKDSSHGKVESQTKPDKDELLDASSDETCGLEQQRFSAHLRPAQAQESVDLAKQLLILIGTLMTSVTSFYFASRTTETRQKDGTSTAPRQGTPVAPSAANASAGSMGDEGYIDGCDIPIVDTTADEDLPPSKGGVA